jgi:stalled ribosome rescue protein Dom34
LLAKNPGKVSYGEKEVMDNLKNGAVDTLLLSEAVDEELIEKFEEAAEEVSSNIRIISVETREGVQLRDMGKIAAILRYEVSVE